MGIQKRTKGLRTKQVKPVDEENQNRSNKLIFGGVILAISSIGLLIFVLSEKVFHLS